MEDQKKGPPRIRNRKSRSKGLRANTGCLTCRQRHLKCDEQKPRCQQCEKSERHCEYRNADPRSSIVSQSENDPVSRPANQSGSLASEPRRGSSARAESSFAAVSVTRSLSGPSTQLPPITSVTSAVGLRDADISTRSGSYTPTSDGGHSAQISPAIGVITSSRSSPQVLFRVPSNQSSFGPPAIPVGQLFPSQSGASDISNPLGALTQEMTDDAAISKWFDLLAGDASIDLDALLDSATIASQSSAQQLATPGEAAEGGWPAARQQSNDRNPVENPVWMSPTELSLQYHELRIFRNFVDNVAVWIDLLDPHRHFSILVPRLALRNIGLMNAILALSSRHLSLNPHLAEGLVIHRNEAIEHYHASLRYVAKGMQFESYNTSDELLATALVISAYEMLDGDGRDWERHLQGIFWIQRSQVIHGDSGGIRAAIWWAWLCQDCWAALKDKRKPFSFWRPERTSFKSMSAWELAARSMFIFKGVVAFCAEKKEDDPNNAFASRQEQAAGLTTLLEEWRRCLPIEFQPLPSYPEADDVVFKTIHIHPSPFAVAMQVHHASKILLALARPLMGGMSMFLEQQNLLSDCVTQICGISKGMDDAASSILNSQCLYIAGTVTHDVIRREEIVRLIQACHARVGWPVRPLDDELRELWSLNRH